MRRLQDDVQVEALNEHGVIGADDRCLCCGKRKEEMKTCGDCKRVQYCSTKCRGRDKDKHERVCQWLQKCKVEEEMEERGWGLLRDAGKLSKLRSLLEKSPAVLSSDQFTSSLTWRRWKEAKKIDSKLLDDEACTLLSAPLTLLFVLCKHEGLQQQLVKGGKQKLVVHVPGASSIESSAPSFLWQDVSRPYQLEVHLIGPQLSSSLVDTEIVKHHACSYEAFCLQNPHSRPDLLLGFNMGLSCPDYSWEEAMKA
eukprot:750992-Hanusia_phi.AAC.1